MSGLEKKINMEDPEGSWREGPWLIHGQITAFENPWIKVDTYPVTMPNSGKPGTYGVVRFKNLAIGVLPLDSEGYTWLVGQHRFPLNEYSWELPEGGGPVGEDPKETALRELEEETGHSALELLPLGSWHLSNSVTDEKAYVFIATGLNKGEEAPDESEVLETRRIKFSDLLDLVMKGEITDSLTVLMVQTAVIKAQRGELPQEISRLLLA